MAIETAIIGGLASATAGALLGKVLGPKMPSGGARAKPTGFTSPGAIITRQKGGTFGLERGADVASALTGFTNQNTAYAGEIDRALANLRPGMGKLTQSRLGAVENARVKAIGNLKENLSRRRVMGSSFAEDAFARAEAEFGQQAERVQAESFLQELELSMNLIQQKHDTLKSNFSVALEQANFESQMAANYANGVNVIMGQNAALQAQLQTQQMQLAAGASAGLGKFFQPTIDAIGKSVSGWYDNTFNSTNPSGTTTGWVP